jgi:hypothetical protein
MICPRCDVHHEANEKTRFEPEKPQWCDECLEDLQEGRIMTRRFSCEDVLGTLGIGNGGCLSGFDDTVDFEAETADLILQSIKAGVWA